MLWRWWPFRGVLGGAASTVSLRWCAGVRVGIFYGEKRRGLRWTHRLRRLRRCHAASRGHSGRRLCNGCGCCRCDRGVRHSPGFIDSLMRGACHWRTTTRSSYDLRDIHADPFAVNVVYKLGVAVAVSLSLECHPPSSRGARRCSHRLQGSTAKHQRRILCCYTRDQACRRWFAGKFMSRCHLRDSIAHLLDC